MSRHCRLIFVAVLTALVALVGAQSERKDVIVWGESYGPDSKGMEARVKAFEAKNPDLRVRVLSMGAGKMNPQKLMTAIVGKVPPDVIKQDRFTISDWAIRGAFRPMDDLMASDKPDDPFKIDPKDYYEAGWNEANFEGKLYAVPIAADDRLLYYNKAIFAKEADKLRAAGLDPSRPPRTWSEVLAYGKALTIKNPDGTLKRAGFIPNYGNSWLYLYAFQNNASFMSADGRTCTLATPETEEALKFMMAGYDLLGGYDEAQKFQATLRGGENDPFVTGNIVMKIDGDWILGEVLGKYGQSLDFGTAPPPVPDDRYNQTGRFKNEKDKFVTWIGGFSLAIPTGARNVDGAWRYIKFMSSAEAASTEYKAQAEWDRRKGRENIPRNMASREVNKALYSIYKPSQKKFADAIKMHMDLTEYARIRPVTFVGQLLWDEHVRAIEFACRKQREPMEALRIGQGIVQKELDAVYTREKYPVINMSVPTYIGVAAAIVALLGIVATFYRAKLGPLGRHEARAGYAFIAPWLIGFGLFTIGPMIASLFFSFTDYNVLNDARWVGLKNFSDLKADEQSLLTKAFMNVLYLGGIGVPLGLMTGLAIALLLNTGVKGMRLYRTGFYLPSIVPTIGSAVLWIFILNSDPNRGIVNGLWSHTISPIFGVPAPGWMQVEHWTKPALILMGLWGAGGGMILWLAGLKGISSTLYEASGIDGATPWQQFWSVTVPQLSPIIFFNTVMGFVGAVQVFDQMYVITGGENAGASDSLLSPVYLLFRTGFTYFKMGYASALAWVIFGIILLLTLVQFVLAPRWVHYEVEK